MGDCVHQQQCGGGEEDAAVLLQGRGSFSWDWGFRECPEQGMQAGVWMTFGAPLSADPECRFRRHSFGGMEGEGARPVGEMDMVRLLGLKDLGPRPLTAEATARPLGNQGSDLPRGGINDQRNKSNLVTGQALGVGAAGRGGMGGWTVIPGPRSPHSLRRTHRSGNSL